MEDSEPESSNTPIQKTIHLKNFPILFLFTLLFFSSSHKLNAQQDIDTSKASIFYQEVITRINCVEGDLGLSRSEFYFLLSIYSRSHKKKSPRSSHAYYSSHSHSHSHSSSHTEKVDSNTKIIYIHDTVVVKEPSDTVFMGNLSTPDTVFMEAPAANAQDMMVAKENLHKILADRKLKSLIRETIKDMSADELKDFKKEMKEDFKDIQSEMKITQAQKKVEELEAKKEAKEKEREANKEARQKRKEEWKSLTKEEKKELVRAKTTLVVHETGLAAGAAAATVGGVVAAGVVAIGTGVIKAPMAIWNWLDERFYVNIDMSCSEQRRLRAYRKSHNYHPPKVKKYRGHCPGW